MFFNGVLCKSRKYYYNNNNNLTLYIYYIHIVYSCSKIVISKNEYFMGCLFLQYNTHAESVSLNKFDQVGSCYGIIYVYSVVIICKCFIVNII